MKINLCLTTTTKIGEVHSIRSDNLKFQVFLRHVKNPKTLRETDLPKLQACVQRVINDLQSYRDDSGRSVAESESKSDNTKAYVFRPKGDFYEVRFDGGETYTIKKTMGMAHIEQLLRYPNTAFVVWDLDDEFTGKNSDREHVSRSYLTASSKGIKSEVQWTSLGKIPKSHAGNAVFDRDEGGDGKRDGDKTLADIEAYKQTLQGKLDVTEKSGQRRALEDEIELCDRYISSAKNIHGRPRKLKNPVEAIRLRVYGRIDRALSNIETHCEALWRHLKTAITTGNECIYRPDREITWEF